MPGMLEVIAVLALLVALLGFQYKYGLSIHQREWVGVHGGQQLRPLRPRMARNTNGKRPTRSKSVPFLTFPNFGVG